MKKALVLLTAFVASLSASANPIFPGRPLDAAILAQVVQSGGFMAPAFRNTTVHSFKTNGEIERTVYRAHDIRAVEPVTVVVGRLSAGEQARLEAAIAEIRADKLIDLDPTSPTGADAPDVSYSVNLRGREVDVAVRAGDFHNYALPGQPAALEIRDLLAKALAGLRK